MYHTRMEREKIDKFSPLPQLASAGSHVCRLRQVLVLPIPFAGGLYAGETLASPGVLVALTWSSLYLCVADRGNAAQSGHNGVADERRKSLCGVSVNGGSQPGRGEVRRCNRRRTGSEGEVRSGSEAK